ncbi:MAG: diguanylate cyclase [Magnetococcales bacterium]|nr:diguanylate cyclase [Magnetococcales bacterium]
MLKVLIVDDVTGNIKILQQALSGDAKIIFATNGKRALELASSEKPDLILLDIIMPQMDGYEVCRILKADNETKNIPVIFITAMDEVKDETKGLGMGAIDYITKPFSRAVVQARVRNHLDYKRQKDMLEKLCSIDGLTEIPNRRSFDQHLEQELRRNLRANTPLSMIIMDVDHFKPFNDNYGHAEGDRCLKQVALTLFKSLERSGDFVARYGGEEFAAIFPDTGVEGLHKMSEKMRTAIVAQNIPHAHSKTAEFITMSLGGITVLPTNDTSPNKIIEAADKNLYKAKNSGRNCSTSSEYKTSKEQVE